MHPVLAASSKYECLILGGYEEVNGRIKHILDWGVSVDIDGETKMKQDRAFGFFSIKHQHSVSMRDKVFAIVENTNRKF